MFRRLGSTVAVCIALVASGVLLGQALAPGDEAAAQRSETGERPEAGEIVATTTTRDVVRELRILRRRLADIKNRNSGLYYLREIENHTSQTCLLVAQPERPPKCL